MVEIVKSGGWLMLPIILCAILAMGIILERFWTLQQKRVIPEDLTSKVWGWVKSNQLDQKQIQTLHQGSALGQILAAGLINRDRDRVVLKDSIEDTGRHVVHELERYLETLGTVAAITPLLGLLGTVIGMVKVFTAITTHGVGDPTVLAGGIAEALITTAAGLTVAIPALIGYRYYRTRVDTLVVNMEKEAIKLVEALHRRNEKNSSRPGTSRSSGKSESQGSSKSESKGESQGSSKSESQGESKGSSKGESKNKSKNKSDSSSEDSKQ